MQNIIEMQHLSFTYTSTPVLENVNLTICAGDTVGLIGANGAGKSTLLRLLLGELTPQMGVVRILGQDARHFRQWQRIGYVPQNSISLGGGFPATAREVVMANLTGRMGWRRFPRKAHEEKVTAALEMVQMQDQAGKMVRALSGGQRQRIMLARVLVNEPEILLLDEPASGIDAQSTHRFYQLLERLNADAKITILMITHDLREAKEHFSRVLCLEEGSVLELDPQQLEAELQHRHKHPCRHCHSTDHPAAHCEAEEVDHAP